MPLLCKTNNTSHETTTDITFIIHQSQYVSSKIVKKKNHGTLLRLEEFLLKKLIRHPQTRRVFLCWCTADHATMRPPLAHSPHEQ